MANENSGNLLLLSESDQIIGDPGEDIRGYSVVDPSGEETGKVDDLLIDDQEDRVRFLRVGSGGFLGIGQDHYLVPVDAVTRINDEDEMVHIDRERQKMGDVPVYDPALEHDRGYYGEVYGYWGHSPYWVPGYAYPGYPYR